MRRGTAAVLRLRALAPRMAAAEASSGWQPARPKNADMMRKAARRRSTASWIGRRWPAGEAAGDDEDDDRKRPPLDRDDSGGRGKEPKGGAVLLVLLLGRVRRHPRGRRALRRSGGRGKAPRTTTTRKGRGISSNRSSPRGNGRDREGAGLRERDEFAKRLGDKDKKKQSTASTRSTTASGRRERPLEWNGYGSSRTARGGGRGGSPSSSTTATTGN